MLSTDNWFCYYNGKVYANRPTSINQRINNKALIASTNPGESTQPETDDTPWFDEDFEDCMYCASADSGHNVHCRNFRGAMLNV